LQIVIQVQCQKGVVFILGNCRQNLLIPASFSIKNSLKKLPKSKKTHINIKNLQPEKKSIAGRNF
tara:strand:- start:1121 stop:1315 length:195 start_codon:yes stop_codon:yes gene_type:complete